MAELRKHRWDDMERERLSEGLGRRLVTGDQVMLAHVYFDAGAEVPRHQHHNEQITYIVDVFSPPRQDWLDGTDAYLRGGR
jgi:hypothetical protein